MAKRGKYKIYLAGPMTGCNDRQLHQWRDEVKKKYDKEFSFFDPTARWSGDPLGKGVTRSEIVEADLRDIEAADGMLVNMWRDSVGAAIGVVHAHRVGTPAVVADPNHLESRMLMFYAVGLEDTPLKAMRTLRNVLRAESWHVLKAGDKAPERFERRKLVESIGKACVSAGKDDVVVPRIVLPEVMDRLKGRLKSRKMGDQITSSDISEAVRDALEAFGNDDVHKTSVEGVLEQWTREAATRSGFADVGSQPAGDASIRISSGADRTIWGNRVHVLGDIPSKEARTFFQTIMNIQGVTEILLGEFTTKEFRVSTKESRVSACGFIRSSPHERGLKGKLFDEGKWGKSMQTFRVSVQYETTKARVLAECEENLRAAGLWDARKGGSSPTA